MVFGDSKGKPKVSMLLAYFWTALHSIGRIVIITYSIAGNVPIISRPLRRGDTLRFHLLDKNRTKVGYLPLLK